jgi:hypothetical protein
MKKLLILIAVFYITSASGQRQGNIWYFADSCGLDFNSGSPVVLMNEGIGNGTSWGTEGTATISDSAGNLLFYANAEKVWNRSHQLMPNGSGLLGGASSSQGAMIIPRPGTHHVFYLFTTDMFQNNLANGLRYSIVNMCLDGGLGDIDPLQKNILLLDSAGEKMAATNHANGTDYWLVCHQFFTDAFYAYRITVTGIIDTVVSHVGTVHRNPADFSDTAPALGQMKISPGGNKIAIAMGNLATNISELFDFDNSTGVVSNTLSLSSENQVYGVAFSPDDSKLYFTTLGSHELIQYDLSSGIPAVIAASRQVVFDAPDWTLSGMQLGPDGKIYIAGNYGFLDVIDSPNIAGTDCNYMRDAIYLDRIAWYGITNFIDSYRYHNRIPFCKSLGIDETDASNDFNIFPNPANDEFVVESAEPGEKEIAIYDVTGRIVHEQKSNQQSTVIFNQLASGIYFVEIKTGNKVHTEKLIIE